MCMDAGSAGGRGGIAQPAASSNTQAADPTCNQAMKRSIMVDLENAALLHPDARQSRHGVRFYKRAAARWPLPQYFPSGIGPSPDYPECRDYPARAGRLSQSIASPCPVAGRGLQANNRARYRHPAPQAAARSTGSAAFPSARNVDFFPRPLRSRKSALARRARFCMPAQDALPLPYNAAPPAKARCRCAQSKAALRVGDRCFAGAPEARERRQSSRSARAVARGRAGQTHIGCWSDGCCRAIASPARYRFSRLRAKQDTDTLVPYPLRALPLADTDEDFLPLHPGGSVRYECAPVPSAALDHWGFEYAAPEILAVHHPVAGWQDRFAR